MSQQTAVTLNTVVYDPNGQSGGIAYWVNRAGGLLNSFRTLSQRFTTNSGSKKLTKITFEIDVPTVATADSSCACTGAVLRTSTAQVSFWVDPGATADERADLYLSMKDLISSTLVQGAVEDLNPAYA